MDARIWTAAEAEGLLRGALGGGNPVSTILGEAAGLGYGVLLIEYRDRQARAESHEAADEVYCVLSGRGELAVGGALVEPRERAPGERLGKGIAGGRTASVGPGDVVSIPRGTPHAMGCPGGAVKYLVVKVY